MTTLLIALTLLTADTMTGKVVSVTDGDTIVVLVDKLDVKVRLDGIDAPERRQAFGNAARERVAALTFGKVVTLHTKGTDRYGRTIATVIADERSINVAMVREGLAWHYREYSKDDELAEAEREARAAKRGLWADEMPVPPWEFRKRPAAKKAA